MTRTMLFCLFLALCTTAGVRAADAPAAPAAPQLDPVAVDHVLAAAYAAAGGERLDAFAATSETGTFRQNGGTPSTFEAVTDLRSGYSKVRLTIGPAVILQGYDGSQWSAVNGALSIVSLPSFVADAVTSAYLGRNAFLRAEQRQTVTGGHVENAGGRQYDVLHVQPEGGSPADLYFDGQTYRLAKTVAQTAQGADTTTDSDYQTVQGIPVAMRSVEVDSSGTITTTVLTSVRFDATLPPGALARPPYVSRGRLAARVAIPFVSDMVGRVGHIVVPVRLEGKRATLIFDSGGSNFLVPAAARRLGLKTSGALATGGAGTTEQMTGFARVSSVDFGGALLENQNFIVTPLGYPLLHPRAGMMPEGLIGYEYLANFRVIVRYAQRRIEVEPFDAPAPSGGVTLPLKSDGSHAYVLASLDGVSGYYLLDTGNSGGLVLNAPFVSEHALFASGGLTYQSPGGVGGGFPVLVSAAKTFQLAGVTFTDVPVGIPQVSSGFFATRGVAGNLGAGVLSRFTLVFDFRAQSVTFIPNRAVSRPFPVDHIGLSLNQSGSAAFDVRGVVPGSPAAEAGIAVGDRILAFAGRRVAAGYGLGDFAPFLISNRPFSLTVERASVRRTVRLMPRSLAMPPQ